MPKNISVALKAHYQSDSLTLCRLWKITRVDGQIFGFTDLDRNVTYQGVTFLAGTGITPSANVDDTDFGVDNMSVESVLTSETITERDLKIGLWDNARLDLIEVNYENLSMGHAWLRSGYLGEVKSGIINFSAEVRGLIQRLQAQVGLQYGPACTATLGDSRCKIVLDLYKQLGSVSTVQSQNVFIANPGIDTRDGWFSNGLIQFTSGENNGFKCEIIKYTSSDRKIVLAVELPFPLATNDTFNIWPGCGKSKEDCLGKFNNILNFRGFPSIPGPDVLKSGQTGTN